MASSLMSTYQPLPLSLAKGQGVWVWDNQGQQYLDSFSGIAVCNLGHAHPKVTETIIEQAQNILHTSNAFKIDNQERLADYLVELSGMEKAFFANSGAEINETALKLARLWARERGIQNPQIIVMDKSFHGRTLATLSASGNSKIQLGFEPLVPGFIHVPFGDTKAVEAILNERKDVVAVWLEPIQGNGGIVIPPEDYLPSLRKLCDQHVCLLMLDEIQTGIGRTGRLFAYQHTPILPDVLTLAKSLGNGIPIGACLARGPAANLFKPGQHGSTFGGNPFASAVAYTVLKTIMDEKLLPEIAQKGQLLQQSLKETLAARTDVNAIRGQGLMIGVEMSYPCAQLSERGLEKGILLNVTAEKVIRILPACTINTEEMGELVSRLQQTIEGGI